MDIPKLCSGYFNGIQELKSARHNTAAKNILAAVKVFSYATVVVPLVIYGISIAHKHRVRKQFDSTAKQKLSNVKVKAVASQAKLNSTAQRETTTSLQNTSSQMTAVPSGVLGIKKKGVDTSHFQYAEFIHRYPGDLSIEDKKNVIIDSNFNYTNELEINFKNHPNIKMSIRVQNMFNSQAEVLVNAANTHLGGGGGIDGAIHEHGETAYADQHKALKSMYSKKDVYPNGFKEGYAVMIGSGKLKEKYNTIDNVIVVAGPKPPADKDSEDKLYSCYYNSLVLANHENKKSIAFPAISTGIFSYPKDRAAAISLRAIRDFLENYPNTTLQSISIHCGKDKKDEYFTSYQNAISTP